MVVPWPRQGPTGQASLLPSLLSLLLQVQPIGCQASGLCTEALGSLCVRCPRPRDARSQLAVSALPQLPSRDTIPLLDAHMGQLLDPSDAQTQCEPYTSACGSAEAGCAVRHDSPGGNCPSPRFGGRAQSLSVFAAVSVGPDDGSRFHSTLVAGPSTRELRLVQAVSQPGSIRMFDTISIPGGETARGYSSVVVAGRWVYYIPGCFSLYASSENLCRTVVRYDLLCADGGWGESICYESADLSRMLLQSFRNKINFGSAVYDGRRYLYLISGVGDTLRTPVAAFVRFDTLGPGLDDPGSWRLIDGIARTPSGAGSFTSAATDGRYLYFMPGPAWTVMLGGDDASVVEREGRLLRYDTWKDSGEAPGDSSNFWYGWAFFEAGVQLHADCQRFSGAVYDGSRYVYMAPLGHTKIVRYDTKYGVAADDGTQDEFGEPRAYTFVDTVEKHLCAGYHCAVGGTIGKFLIQAAGRYIYAVVTNWAGSVVLKHDTELPFAEREGWECICVATIAAASVQYRVGTGMMPPADAPTFNSFFAGAVTYDGRQYVYMVPARVAEGPLVRLDTRGAFTGVESWEAVDLTHHSSAVDIESWKMFGGIASDGRHLYTTPSDYLENSVYEYALPGGGTNDYIGALFRIDPHTSMPAFELEVASAGAGGGPGGGQAVGVVWSVAAGGGVATVASGDMLSPGTHVIVASFSPQLDATSSSTISLYVDGVLADSIAYSRASADPSHVGCHWLDGDSECTQEWGGCSAGVDNSDCASVQEYGGGEACALDSMFWDGDLVDMRVWEREVLAAEAASLTTTWFAHGVAPPARPPPPPPPPPPEPVAEPEEPNAGGNPGTSTDPPDTNTGVKDGDKATGNDGGAGGLAMLIPIFIVGGIATGVAAYCVTRSCGRQGGRKKAGVSPYDAGEESKEGLDDFRDVMFKVEAAIAAGADGAGVQGIEQWSVGALKRWLTRTGVQHMDSYERSELIGRVLSRWLQMSADEKREAAEAARRENSNEGSAWWRAGEATGVKGAGAAEESADTPTKVSAAKAAKEAFEARADEWFRANGNEGRDGRQSGNSVPGSDSSYADEAAREREARTEREGRDKHQQQQEDAAAWEKEKARRREAAAEREMAAQAAASEAAARRRQEAEWARQKEAQRKRDSGQTAREAELQRQKEQYQRELERRMAMERNESAEKAQNAARNAAAARAAAKRKEEERLREQMAEREREAARKRRAAASQPTGTPSRASGNGAAGHGGTRSGERDPDGIRVGGGERIDPELARKQNDRVRELRRAEAKKERDAQDMAGVQKRVDMEVDRWARAKDLPAMLRTLGHIIDGAPAIQTDGSDVRKAMLKALRIVHPDKIDPNASAAYKAKAQRVFTTLQAAHKQ